jgi:drug/metabolite transporter (DMT)-like permease
MNLLLLLLLGMLWGSSYLFIKVIVAEVPVTTLVTGRLALSAIILWLLLLGTRRQVPRGWSLWKNYAVMGLLNGTVPYVLISWGEQYIPSSLAALLQATMPLFTVLLAAVTASDEGLKASKVAGVVVGFVGVGILMLPDLHQGLQVSILGQLAIVGSSLSYAGAGIFARRYLRSQPPLASTAGQLTMGALFTFPLSLMLDWPLSLSPSLPAIASWLALSILGTVVAYVIYYILIERTSATFVSTVTYIIPINGLILGAVVLGEVITPGVLASSALILLGVLLVRAK